MIRILYVHHGKGIGGAPLSLLYLIRGLDRKKFEPTVLCLHESEAADLYRNEGIETIVREDMADFSHTNVLWYPWWQFPKTVLRFIQYLRTKELAAVFFRQRRFDLVHLNTSTLIAFGKAAHEAGMKVAWHIREPVAKGYFGIRRNWIRKMVDRYADAIFPICKYDASQLIASERIEVVYNFVDFEQFDASLSAPEVRNELGLSDDQPIVLMLGGSNPIKGTHEYIEAAVKVADKVPEAVFLITGSVPERSLRTAVSGSYRYFRRCLEAIPERMRERIRFIGVRQDIPKLLSETAILVFPSTVAHFARPVIEASAMGVPAVASDIGGPKELILHGKTGYLVPPADSEALAESIRRLLETPELRTEMGKNGIEFARQNFDSGKNTEQVIQAYFRLLEAA